MESPELFHDPQFLLYRQPGLLAPPGLFGSDDLGEISLVGLIRYTK